MRHDQICLWIHCRLVRLVCLSLRSCHHPYALLLVDGRVVGASVGGNVVGTGIGSGVGTGETVGSGLGIGVGSPDGFPGVQAPASPPK